MVHVHLQALLGAPPAVYGLAVGALGVLVLAFLLPKHERRLVRGPLILLLVYGAARSAVDLFPPTDIVPKLLRFIAAFAWGTAAVRGLFVLFTSSRVMRWVPAWPKILRDIVQGVLYVGVGLASLRAVGVEPSSLLTTSALLTAVIGLSLQETLGNLFAGLALQSQQTVSVGDWIRFADGDDGIGEVIEINWRATHFLTFKRVQVVVPNGVLARATVRNFSRPTPLCRIDTDVVLPYSLSPERARSILVAALQGVDGILSEPVPTTVVGDFTDAGVSYSVRFFITDFARQAPIEGAARQRILYALRRAHIELPFPYRHLDLVGPLASKLLAPPEAKPADPKAPEAKRSSVPPGLAARLAKTELFRGLEGDLLARLAESVHPELYSPGEIIIRQGDPGTDLYALEQGRVELVVGAENGAAIRASTLEPGAIFGEAAFMTGGRRVATIVALVECEVLVIPRSALHHLLAKNASLSERLTKILADRMDLLSQALNQAAETGVDEDRRSDMLFERIRQFFGQ